jgi:acyl-CoA carboxylase subunit beta
VQRCSGCDADLAGPVPGWCRSCGRGERVGARELLAWLVPDAIGLGDTVDVDRDPLSWPDYPDVRERARTDTDLDEAVVTARGTVRGSDIEVVVVAWDFRFLGGSMSSAVGQRIADAYDAAATAGTPIVLLPSTGGARMQEGMASLVQMAATSVAADAHARAGLLQVAVLRDPTTGGVFASHANLADVLLVEAGATVGFAGPRVSEAMTGGTLPSGSHTARGALAAGLVDAVVARPDLPAALGRVLSWTAPDALSPVAAPEGRATARIGEPWAEVERARADDRPRASEHLAAMDVAMELHGDRAGGDDPTVRVGLVRLAGRRAVVVAMDRHARGGRIGPGGYRKAWRGLRLAGRLGVPVVTLIDTPGADASAGAEAGGIAHHIARTFTEVLAVPSPVVALVIGEGGSGGALALAVGDRLLIQQHATFSVIAPEGAAAILHRDTDRAAEVAALLRLRSTDLAELGIADEVVPEPDGDAVAAAQAAVVRALDDLAGAGADRLEVRRRRWRRAGSGVGPAVP